MPRRQVQAGLATCWATRWASWTHRPLARAPLGAEGPVEVYPPDRRGRAGCDVSWRLGWHLQAPPRCNRSEACGWRRGNVNDGGRTPLHLLAGFGGMAARSPVAPTSLRLGGAGCRGLRGERVPWAAKRSGATTTRATVLSPPAGLDGLGPARFPWLTPLLFYTSFNLGNRSHNVGLVGHRVCPQAPERLTFLAPGAAKQARGLPWRSFASPGGAKAFCRGRKPSLFYTSLSSVLASGPNSSQQRAMSCNR